MLEITKENYEGYTKLAEIQLTGPLAFDKKSAPKISIELGLFALMVFLLLAKIAIAVFMPILIFGYPVAKLYRNYNKKIKQLKEEYPYIDTEVSDEELINALKKVNILKYNFFDEIILNKNGYLEYLENEENKRQFLNKCEQIKNEVINKYDIHDSFVTENELAKVKQKIKVLTK